LHRFTESTPTSLAGKRVIEVVVDNWEIECCAPPPVVGEPSSWRLQFVEAAHSRDPELHREMSWYVEPRDSGAELTDGPVTAFWPSRHRQATRPGRRSLSGHLSGTVHGGMVPEEIPETIGIVHRIRVLSQRFVLRDDLGQRGVDAVPGTLSFTDVARAPRWFNRSEIPREDHADNAQNQFAVLLDLAVART
jgi:hypothetical protein